MAGHRASRVVTYLLALLVAGHLVAAGALLAADPSWAAGAYVGIAGVLGLASAGLGLLVARRRPGNVVGPLLVLNGLAACSVMVNDAYGAVLADRPGLLPVNGAVLAFSGGSWMFLYVPAALLMLFFPDGRLPGPRWRIAAIGLVAVPVLFDVLVAFDPSPYPAPYQRVPHLFGGIPKPVLTAIMVVALSLLPVLLGLLVASAAAMVVRYRRATDPVARAQVTWFALGALCLPATLLLCWASYLLLGSADLVLFGLAVTYLAIPTATAIALLRHDLYDVDKAISATVTYGLVTAALLAFYTAAAFLAGLTVGRSSVLAAAAATALCAAALSPLRHNLQRRVDRRLYPQREAALAGLDDLRRRTHTGEAQPEELEAVLRRALRDPELRVGYVLPGSTDLVDAAGGPLAPGDRHQAAVLVAGRPIGALVRGSTGSAALLRELAVASTLHVELVRLRMGLAVALRDAESSRTRLLHAGYSERRRLERDLHDGAQQRLVSLGMNLRLAQRHLGDGSVDLDGLLDQSVAELGTAVAELRQLAHGLRPSSLNDGLTPALTLLAEGLPVPVTLDLRIGVVPDDIATTVYYVASEAVTNAVKHASATAIGVHVEHDDGGALTMRISDDGLGGARIRPGAGLAGLADRVAAAGGDLWIASDHGRGTVVGAVLPCVS
ncbi:MAG: putative two-component system histidine kinase [Actinomycetia bacterium]|nr:putative two-component system histidine kinase [Actinomycetes bacterium]